MPIVKNNSSQVKALLESTPVGQEILELITYHQPHGTDQLWFIASCLQQSEDFTESMDIERVNLTVFLGDINRILDALSELLTTD